jgi:hypothetical protein
VSNYADEADVANKASIAGKSDEAVEATGADDVDKAITTD